MTDRRRFARAGLALLLLVLGAATLLQLGATMVANHRWRNRGVEIAPPQSDHLPGSPWGVNAALEQYDPHELETMLDEIQATGWSWIRQRLPWDAIEPERDALVWAPWDRIVAEANERGIKLLLVLERSPAWARSPEDAGNPWAPPVDADEMARWAALVARRYGDRVAAYQVWDQPNISPHWGDRDVDPAGYARLLSAVSASLHMEAPEATIVSAGLAPNNERGGKNLSDLTYLAGMYDAGAAGSFDAQGAKPYGFWSGPDDRRVSADALNWSRTILLREEMVRRGDGNKPIWAVEMGWNALPIEWAGAPSPWGTDSEPKQSARTLQALTRARREWPWLGLTALQHWQPASPANDPRWGFALLDAEGTRRLLHDEIADYLNSAESDPVPYVPPIAKLCAALAIVGLGLAVIAWRMTAHLRTLPLGRWWIEAREWYLAQPEPAQALINGAALLIMVASPWSPLTLLALWCILVLTLHRLEWTLLLSIPLIPFTPYSVDLWGLRFTYAETLTFIMGGAWLLRDIARSPLNDPGRWRKPRSRVHGARGMRAAASRLLASLGGIDGFWIGLLALGVLSVAMARFRGVALREFRTTTLGPALLYLLVTRARPLSLGDGEVQVTTGRFLRAMVDALALAGALLSLQGLAQLVTGGDVIVAEGVRRVRGIYASPNNLSLMLDRLLPLALVPAIWGRSTWRRWLHGLAAGSMALCLFLTFSRGAWLLGVPAALLFVGALKGRRTTLFMIAAIVLVVALLVPFAGSERISSLADVSGGTTLFRLSLWRSTVDMLADNPLFGVGLDNFLYYYPDYIRPEAAAEPNLSHPHNILLDFWVRLGIAGIGLLAWLIYAIMRRGLGLWKRLAPGDDRAMTLGLLAGAVAMLAHGLVDQSYFTIELAFTFALTSGWLRRTTNRLGESE
jgi:hypothetical protein